MLDLGGPVGDGMKYKKEEAEKNGLGGAALYMLLLCVLLICS